MLTFILGSRLCFDPHAQLPSYAHRRGAAVCTGHTYGDDIREASTPSVSVNDRALTGKPDGQVDVSLAAHSLRRLLKEQRVFISIAGLIGAGKSTLAAALGETIGVPVYFEPIAEADTNHYLADFYADMRQYSFPLQVHLLNKRFRQQQEIIWSDAGAIQDRSIYEDSVFASVLAADGLMDARDYATYLSLFSTMSRFMQRPDVIVYLDVSPEESLRRIRLRRRECESDMTLEYLVKLAAAYEDFIADISRSVHVIRIDYSEFRSADEMADEIARQWADRRRVRPYN